MEVTDPKYQQMLLTLLEYCRVNVPRVNKNLIEKAFNLSFEAHRNDIRASGEPYFEHPYAVALIVAKEIPLDDISVISALLHDVVEDTDFDLEFIIKEFGTEVAEIVDGVTKISGLFTGHEIIKAENYRKLLLSMIKDVRVILVKFADRLHNMRTLEWVNPQKQRRIALETLDIYAPFANRFGLGQIKWELEDLAFKYLNHEAYEDIAKKIKNKRKEREAYLNKFVGPIITKLKEHGIKFEIGGRPKHIHSIYKKMMKQNTTFENIYDLLAVRIILEENNANECYYVLGIINLLYKPVSERFKDYISIPKKNNYQSIHTTVIGPDGKLVEVQIRTRKMHEIAEKGVAAHWRYKENLVSSDNELEDWVNWVRDIFENASKSDATREIIDSFKLNLYQDEIYVFTPKGDLKRLPVNSTPVDFAFEVHSNVGYHCIGAKVNSKIVPLDTVIHSGDQVDILTSKNQHPHKSWLNFVKTHKAKSAIRKFISKEEERLVEIGQELFEKKAKKLKLNFEKDDIVKLARKLKYDSLAYFYQALAKNEIDIDLVINPPAEEKDKKLNEIEFENFADDMRTSTGDVLVEGFYKGFKYDFAKCCNPIPGDPIVGYVTIGEGIKIHRKDCSNLIMMLKKGEHKIVSVAWPMKPEQQFVAGIKIKGQDKAGVLNEITNSISNYKNTNIRSVNISATDSMFSGAVTVYVNDLDHLNHLIDRIRKIKGIYSAVRFDSNN